jgi:hypothetical protein
MSDITKNDDATEMPVESPLEGADESVSDVPENKESESAIEQIQVSIGSDEDSQPENGAETEDAIEVEAPEGSAPDVAEDRAEGESNDSSDEIANGTQEDQSFWGGFFGKPNIPTVR